MKIAKMQMIRKTKIKEGKIHEENENQNEEFNKLTEDENILTDKIKRSYHHVQNIV